MTRKQIVVSILCLALAACAAWLIKKQFDPIDSSEIKLALIELRSQSLQARLLLEATLAGATTRAYYSGELSLLREKTSSTLDELTSRKPASPAAAHLSHAITLTQTLNDRLRSLSTAYADRDTMAAIRDSVVRIAQEILALEAALNEKT